MHPGRRLLLIALLAPALTARAGTPPPELSAALPAARLQGEGRLRFFGLHVYDVRLWTAAAFAPERWAEAPLALEIEYARTLYGKAIAERSLDEMKRQGDLAADRSARWLADMTRLFPDVKEGDRITGVQQPGAGVSFFINGKARGEVRDADFARRFFGIWLAPQTSEPGLRDRLFGRTP
jgi:hypothetical protein